VVAIVIIALLLIKTRQSEKSIYQPGVPAEEESVMEKPPESTTGPGTESVKEKKLPRLVDLGAGKCIPCKMMAPILEELKKEYRGRLEVEVIDVWEDPQAGQRYGIRVIPTQIFYDASGKEVFRHEGFLSKEDILVTLKKLGIDLEGTKP